MIKFLALVLILGCQHQVQNNKQGLRFVAVHEIQSSTTFENAPLGGISGLTELTDDEYMAIIDDRSEYAPARMVKFKITFEDQKLIALPLKTFSLSKNGKPFALNEIDSEAIVSLDDQLIIASEGSYRGNTRFKPFISSFNQAGAYVSDYKFNHDRYIPEDQGDMTKGVRSNLGFESLSLSPSGKLLFTVNEAALRQDAEDDYHSHNIVRLMSMEIGSDSFTKEYAIKLDHVQEAGHTGENGVSDILALSDTEVLILERSWISKLKKQNVKIYKVTLDDSARVESIDSLKAHDKVLTKKLVFDFSTLDIKIDNLEALTFGPLIDGKKSLIVASDNNFSKYQITQFLLFEILDL
tara:strand:- start:11166 stop:12224 length:1059 start_codon:yes stop_codon:yes gene_type:complete